MNVCVCACDHIINIVRLREVTPPTLPSVEADIYHTGITDDRVGVEKGQGHCRHRPNRSTSRDETLSESQTNFMRRIGLPH